LIPFSLPPTSTSPPCRPVTPAKNGASIIKDSQTIVATKKTTHLAPVTRSVDFAIYIDHTLLGPIKATKVPIAQLCREAFRVRKGETFRAPAGAPRSSISRRQRRSQVSVWLAIPHVTYSQSTNYRYTQAVCVSRNLYSQRRRHSPRNPRLCSSGSSLRTLQLDWNGTSGRRGVNREGNEARRSGR